MFPDQQASAQAFPQAPAWGGFGLLADLVRLTKPRITVMVIVTGLGGMWLSARTGAVAAIDWRLALWALSGLALVVSGAGALNMYWERDTDRLMARTANRPLPAGRMQPDVALWFGIALSAAALTMLAAKVNLLTAALAAFALLVYVLVYTPLKRVTTKSLVIGAVPGAMPPLLGWTAATNEIALPGLALFAVLFFWQLPHFIAIATFRESEFNRAGIKVLPTERGARTARVHALVYSALLLLSSLALVPLGVGGTVYMVNALALGAIFVIASATGLSRRALQPAHSVKWARSLFAVSLFYLPLLVAAIMVGA
jgi:protoheme IX farnesyltransferase